MTEKERKKSGGISRREFLKDAGLVVGGAAIGSTVLLAACGGEETTTTVTETATQTQTATKTVTIEVPVPPEELITLTVNGATHKLYIEPNWTLLDVLRERLGLTGSKRWCDLGECGFCSVILDGRLVNSCIVLAIECNGSEVLTIEGLAEGERLHPIQEAFIDNMGFQCGTCTPGMIMSAKTLLDANPNPTQEEVKQALAGVMCKCGHYTAIFKSVLEAAKKIGGG